MTGLIFLAICLQSTSSTKNEVKIEVKGEYRFITSNGMPDHKTGQFPGNGNPNAISPQKYNFRVPAHPKVAETTTELRMQDFGVAVNGVPFDPGTAEWWNNDRSSGWHWEGVINGVKYLGIDLNNAHVQPTGAYHYHAIPIDLMKSLGGDGSKMVLIGWAADGFPMYGTYGHSVGKNAKSSIKTMNSSYRLKPGTRPSGPNGPGGAYDGSFEQDWNFVKDSGDLDECNGRFGLTPEFPNGTYYYVVSEAYPWIPRKYRGTPDASFRRGPGARGGRPGGPPPDGGGN